MRIWSLHPKYLDVKGLVALWRETLLVQNVLLGKTKGYKNHPQLDRFKSQPDPMAVIGYYLLDVYNEAVARDYNFNKDKIACQDENVGKVTVKKDQLGHEFNHLKKKLKTRDPKKYQEISEVATPSTHPLFRVTEGQVEDWERI